MRARQILILSRFDSFARVGKRVADGFASHGYTVTHKLLTTDKNDLSPRMRTEIGLDPGMPVSDMWQLFHEEDLSVFSAIFLGATGDFVKNFLARFEIWHQSRGGAARPLVISVYPGIILREKLAGFADRCGCDMILLNSHADQKEYEFFCNRYSLNSKGGRLFGYVFPRAVPNKKNENPEILFIEQAVVPASEPERRYLVKRLLEYAATHPDRQITIKPRLRPGEKSIFSPRCHLEDILGDIESKPGNLKVDYSDIQLLLNRAHICLSVSSTAALQAMWYGIPTGIISDFGFRDAYGIDFFKDSGCLMTFDDFDRADPRLPHASWMNQNFSTCDDHMPETVQAVTAEYDRRKKTGHWSFNGNLRSVYGWSLLEYQQNLTHRKRSSLFQKGISCLDKMASWLKCA